MHQYRQNHLRQVFPVHPEALEHPFRLAHHHRHPDHTPLMMQTQEERVIRT